MGRIRENAEKAAWVVGEAQGTWPCVRRQVNSWRSYFAGLCSKPTASFPFFFPSQPVTNKMVLPSPPTVSSSLAALTSPAPTPELAILQSSILRQQAGPPVEPITHPAYTKNDKKRKLAAFQALKHVDILYTKGSFVFINLPIDDPDYKLPLALGKISFVEKNAVTVNWWIYAGYPKTCPTNHKGPWQRLIIQGPGQKQDSGICMKEQIVLSFPNLNQNRTVPHKTAKLLDQLLARGLDSPVIQTICMYCMYLCI
jgi:hypothetical protein